MAGAVVVAGDRTVVRATSVRAGGSVAGTTGIVRTRVGGAGAATEVAGAGAFGRAGVSSTATAAPPASKPAEVSPTASFTTSGAAAILAASPADEPPNPGTACASRSRSESSGAIVVVAGRRR